MPPAGAPPAFCRRSRTVRAAAFAAAINWRYRHFWISSTCDGWIFNWASTSTATSLAAFASPKSVSDPLCTAALWNSPFADGAASSVDTFPPPPDWPEDHHVARVTAEPRDVAVHPLECRHQIDDAEVARQRVLLPVGREVEKPSTLRRWFTLTTTTSPVRERFSPS